MPVEHTHHNDGHKIETQTTINVKASFMGYMCKCLFFRRTRDDSTEDQKEPAQEVISPLDTKL